MWGIDVVRWSHCFEALFWNTFQAILPSCSELLILSFVRLAENWFCFWMASLNSGNLLYYLSLRMLMLLFLVTNCCWDKFVNVISTGLFSIRALPTSASILLSFVLFSLLISILQLFQVVPTGWLILCRFCTNWLCIHLVSFLSWNHASLVGCRILIPWQKRFLWTSLRILHYLREVSITCIFGLCMIILAWLVFLLNSRLSWLPGSSWLHWQWSSRLLLLLIGRNNLWIRFSIYFIRFFNLLHATWWSFTVIQFSCLLLPLAFRFATTSNRVEVVRGSV